MNKDQKLLEQAYRSILESSKQPLYFGPPRLKEVFMKWLTNLDHEVHHDGSVSIDDEVSFIVNEQGEKDIFDNIGQHIVNRLPFNFRKVTGDFWCPFYLQSLKGSPEHVGGNFHCSRTEINSLHGSPKVVEKSFHCNSTNIVSIEGAPEIIGKKFISTKFSDEDYRAFAKKRKYVEGKLDKDLDVDLDDFS